MKRYLQIGLLPFISLLLFGCPYESKIPISKASEKVDTKLLGRWESEDEVYNSYTISQADTYHYNIVQRASTGETRKYKGFVSRVRGGTFLNAFSDSTKMYYLYRLKIDSVNSSVLVMPFAHNLPEHFTDTTELNNYVWRSMNLRDFYDVEDQATFKLVGSANQKYN